MTPDERRQILIGRIVEEAAKMEFHLDDFLWKFHKTFFDLIERCADEGGVDARTRFPHRSKDKGELFLYILENHLVFDGLKDKEGKADFLHLAELFDDLIHFRNILIHGAVDMTYSKEGEKSIRAWKYPPNVRCGYS